jgi:putative endonuclease
MSYFTYAIYSETFSEIYIGYTHNLVERLYDHNVRAKKGYTIRFRPWKLIYFEEFEDKKLAMKREKELKTAKGRAFIHRLLKTNPGSGG